MISFILSKLDKINKRYEEIKLLLNDANIIKNISRFKTLSREYSKLSNILEYFNIWHQIQKSINAAKSMLNDPEMHQIAQEELELAKSNSKSVEHQLKILLLPKDEDDERNVFIEIRAGTGGKEAALFAKDLFRMYNRYAEMKHWVLEIININTDEYGGYKEIVAKIIGTEAYGCLKFESGGHRVQRIPNTESQGRIHTSTCTVAVIPESPEENNININNADLRIDTFRSSGAGGQHVNKTDSAIRITHLPTNIVVECQDGRSQHKNKAKALSVLMARLHAEEKAKRQKTETLVRRSLLGSGDRNDRKRTYNFPHKRVTDHRINLTVYNLEDILNGNLDLIIKPLIREYQSDLLFSLTEKDNNEI